MPNVSWKKIEQFYKRWSFAFCPLSLILCFLIFIAKSKASTRPATKPKPKLKPKPQPKPKPRPKLKPKPKPTASDNERHLTQNLFSSQDNLEEAILERSTIPPFLSQNNLQIKEYEEDIYRVPLRSGNFKCWMDT